ncbi:MAG: hypothetical protein Q9169_001940 [Polycauliona sp. 2 TL-2023]
MAKISFSVGAKQGSSDITPASVSTNPLNRYPHLRLGFFTNESTTKDNVNAATSKTRKTLVPSSPFAPSPAPLSKDSTFQTATTRGNGLDLAEHTTTTFHFPEQPIRDMAEPPVKRAKRTDSAAMWERTSKPPDTRDKPRNPPRDTKPEEGRDRRDDEGRKYGRGERTRRSRSRSWSRDRRRYRDGDRRTDRSRSREWRGKRAVHGDYSPPRDREGRRRRDGERRDRDRSVSNERHRSRRDELAPRRPDRHRSRSRSPARDPKSNTRTRSPPRGTSSKPLPSGPSKQSRPSASPPPAKAPPKGPKSNKPPLPKTNGTTPTAPPNGKPAAAPPSKMDIDEDSDPETAQMRRMMGFADFKTTKNTKVPGNDVYAVRKEKKTEYRQYMNRVGGFNRPLSPSR